MPYELQQTGELTQTAAVTVPGKAFQKEVNKALQQLSGRVKVPGFRKGHIPLQVMQQRYGDSVTRDVIESLVQKHVDEILQEFNNVLYLETPRVTELPGKDSGEMKFSFTFELSPQVDPVGYLGVEIKRPRVDVSAEDIDKTVAELQERLATLEPIALRTTIATGDVVTLDFQALGDDERLADLRGNDVQVEVGQGMALPGIEQALEGAAFDAVLQTEVIPGDAFPIEEYRQQPLQVKLTVKNVQRRVRPELTDDFAKSTAQGATMLELRANIRKRLAEQREHQAEHVASDSLMERLLEANSIALPERFVEQQVHEAAQRQVSMFERQGVSIEQLGIDIEAIKADMRESVITNIKSDFLLSAIARKEELKVEEGDLQAYFEHRALHMGVTARQLESYIRQDADGLRHAFAEALLEKTRRHLIAQATVVETEALAEQGE